MKKLNVGVVMGGESSEYEISLLSGNEVIKNIDQAKFNPVPVIISKDNAGLSIITWLKDHSIDVVFIAMHGRFGEDGALQGLLELVHIPYTGSGVLASAIGMDKLIFRKLLASSDIEIPNYVSLRKGQDYNIVHDEIGSSKYFVKPHNQGSSVGTSIVVDKSQMEKALDKAYKYSNIALVDEYIAGKEITCGILGSDTPLALPLVEIKPKKGEFFDYDSKYSEGGADEIVPAPIPTDLTKSIQKSALTVYQLLGCRGFARVDFLLKEDNSFVVLEINTIPGLTPASLFPKAAYAAGISFRSLITKLIGYALDARPW